MIITCPHPAPRAEFRAPAQPRRAVESGFSLVELIVVLLIAGILMGAFAMSGRGTKDSAAVQLGVATAKSYNDAVSNFVTDHGGRTPKFDTIDWPETPMVAGRSGGAATVSKLPPYSRGPVNPSASDHPYIARVPDDAATGELVVTSAALNDPAKGARVRLLYTTSLDTKWRFEVQLNGANGWTTKCYMGTLTMAGRTC